MQVIGVTTQQEVHIVSRTRKFHINEILVIEDPSLQDPKGEVVETLAYNRLIPMGLDKSLVDHQILETLKNIGYDIESDEINVAKLRLFEEAPYPVRTGCRVRLPRFEEVRKLLVKTTPQEGMVLGEIRGTESMASSISPDLKDQVAMLEQGKYRPQKGIPFLFDIKTMQQYPHVGIFGGSGSGKSFGLRVMLEELMKLRIPTIVFDPHFEMDFRDHVPELKDRCEKLQNRSLIVQIGRDVGISFHELSTRDIENLLRAAGGNLTDAMVSAVQELHKRRDSYTSFSDRVSNLVKAQEEGANGLRRRLEGSDLTPREAEQINELLALLKEYNSLPAASVRGIHWRLNRLEKAGLFQHDIRSIEQGLELGKLVVVQGSSWVLQVFATYVIGSLYRKRREYKDQKLNGEEGRFFPPFVIVTDEAHNFAPKGVDSPAKSTLREIAQEGRKYGVFLFLATQRPTLLDETITAQLNTKFVFRTVRGTDIQTLREETDLTPEEAKRLPYLRSGDTFVSSAAFGRTVFIRIRAAYTRSPHVENPFDELEQVAAERNDKVLAVIEKHLPVFETDLLSLIGEIRRECGLDWDLSRFKQELDRLSESGQIVKHETPFVTRYDRK